MKRARTAEGGGGPRQSGTRAHAQVLILLALTLFGGPGGGDLAELPALVRAAIEDEERADAAAAVAEEIQLEVRSTQSDLLAYRRGLLAALTPYEADLSGLPDAGEEFDTRMWKHQERTLALRERLRELMSRAEWTELFDALREARER